jgi:hypothetical protein
MVDQMDILLGLGGNIDRARAELVLNLALQRASAVVSPVPDEALPIILDAAGRAYSNPQGATAETAGPFGRTFSMPGVYLTKRERADLRAMAGEGGAFTINPTPADAAPPPYWPSWWWSDSDPYWEWPP